MEEPQIMAHLVHKRVPMIVNVHPATRDSARVDDQAALPVFVVWETGKAQQVCGAEEDLDLPALLRHHLVGQVVSRVGVGAITGALLVSNTIDAGLREPQACVQILYLVLQSALALVLARMRPVQHLCLLLQHVIRDRRVDAAVTWVTDVILQRDRHGPSAPHLRERLPRTALKQYGIHTALRDLAPVPMFCHLLLPGWQHADEALQLVHPRVLRPFQERGRDALAVGAHETIIRLACLHDAAAQGGRIGPRELAGTRLVVRCLEEGILEHIDEVPRVRAFNRVEKVLEKLVAGQVEAPVLELLEPGAQVLGVADVLPDTEDVRGSPVFVQEVPHQLAAPVGLRDLLLHRDVRGFRGPPAVHGHEARYEWQVMAFCCEGPRANVRCRLLD
mmetsp:Transcript_67492/g.187090  ORF Transcript_67492/g.187090 Transcript_67492/m.187090 type:complete len:390 (+) Transcript_67492:361-1530(+)